ncbi:MAG: pyridoxamine 5'-phosphate oxidase family protein [Cytophagales bacterium]|nr:pyridoxamine 5'-phosphate oxidase family protein [Cytophagales bacterium]
MLNDSIKESLEQCVLCWLATVDENGIPNVSPKEAFLPWEDRYVIIANIASPGSVRNIRQNDQVCVSVLDILVQKGHKMKGTAAIIDSSHEGFNTMKAALDELTMGKFPFNQIIRVEIQEVTPIIAPSYHLYPKQTEAEIVEASKKQYGLN